MYRMIFQHNKVC